jgi:ankyrin repeat protein
LYNSDLKKTYINKNMKSLNLSIIKLSLISFITINCQELLINTKESNSQESSPEPTQSFQDQLIVKLFGEHERENVQKKILTNLSWQKRLGQAMDDRNKKKFKKELDACDEAIGLHQFICPIQTSLVGEAAFRGLTDNVEQMIKYDFNPNAEYNGSTPLNIALKKFNRGLLNLLLTSPKIDVNKIDSTGFSPLMISLMSNNVNHVSILLDHGATTIDNTTSIFNIDLKNCKHMTPEIKELIFDYSERNKIARTPVERWLDKNKSL